VLLCAAATLCGCSSADRALAPVSGKVTLDGKPLSGGGVSFQPIAPPGTTSAGRGSVAFCDDDGNFTLNTIDGNPGAIVGSHRVRIYGPRNKIASADDTSSGATTEIVPAKYNFQTTLTFDVPPDGSDDANFELTSE
jgi:hypothetical protein